MYEREGETEKERERVKEDKTEKWRKKDIEGGDFFFIIQ